MNRRDFIVHSAAGLAGVAGASLIGTSANLYANGNPKPMKRPKNVLLLFSDQHRPDTLGCYGNSIVKTPNIDRLAKHGVRFDNAFTPTATCSPARTCVQTGVLAHRHRIMFNSGGPSKKCGGAHNLSDEWPAFASSLKEKGYNLAHVGKWHIGVENRPADFGYEGVFYPYYGYPAGHKHYLNYLKELGVGGFNLSEVTHHPEQKRFRYSGIQEGPVEASAPGYLASQTVDYIDKFARDDKPFFVSCNFWGPHAPYFIPEKYFRMYEGVDIEPWPNFRYDQSDKPRIYEQYGRYWGVDRFSRKQLSDLIARYYGYITLIDEQVGRILKTLEDTGQLEDTLIIYSADHGATVGSHGMWDKGFGMHDCTQRIPLVVSHAGLRGKGAVSDEFVTLMDFAPTFLEQAGCPVPETCDGKSLWPAIDHPEKARRRDHVICEHFGHQMPFWQRMVRDDRYKYVYNPTDVDEFYDLENDPHEMTNLAARIDKARIEPYRDRLREFIERTGDPMKQWARTTL